MKPIRVLAVLTVLAATAQVAAAQATIADYQRAMGLRDAYDGLAIHTADAPRWIEQTSRFYYRRTVKGGDEWILVDGTTREKRPAFDHAKMAEAVASATKRKATAVDLPFVPHRYVRKA